MTLYGFKIDYVNSYQGFSYHITPKAFLVEDSRLSELIGERVDVVGEDAIIFFDRLFSKYLRIAYVDLVNADKAEVEVVSYGRRPGTYLIHKIVWRHLGNKTTYIVLWVDESLSEHVAHYTPKELGELGVGLPAF